MKARTSWVTPGTGTRVGDLLLWIGRRREAAALLPARDVCTDLEIVRPGPPEDLDLVRAQEALRRVGLAS